MPYLTGTMESVLAQDLHNIEVIAVNDGSTDGSGEELDRFAALDSRVTVHHQPNSGWPGMPRNRGLEIARGTFVMFMDSDDTLAENALSSLVNMAEDRQADVVIPRFQGTGGRQVQGLFLSFPEGDIGLPRAMETLSPQKLFRRSMIEQDQLRFPEGKVRLEDGIFITRAYTIARRIAFCGTDPLYFIAERDDGQNISARPIDPDNYVSSCRKIAELLRDGVPDAKRSERLIRQFFSRKGLRFYAAKRWLKFDAARKQRWVTLHQQFLQDFVSSESDALIQNVTDRRKVMLIRAGDVAGLDRLISAEQDLVHTNQYLGGTQAAYGVELLIAIKAEDATGVLGQSRTPATWRLNTARLVHRVLRPFFGHHFARGLSRKLSQFAVGHVPGAYLMLAGRRVRNAIAVPGRLVGAEGGSLHFRFVLPEQLLKRFPGERVDMWTIAEVHPNLSGRQARVRTAPLKKGQKLGGIAYATNQGNLSLDLRKKRG
ncbi:glycosyltransferase family 2 protein [Leucobacter viscericola]|uniref:Glycosyltransferase family 2 protein n=2 Tax=Leucobacter viscericola TaxID=2714935 RepID=A0A6G7XKG7_9MICO|nr:glycosyltransferase family 2 protein [Leucobacter viscericola]